MAAPQTLIITLTLPRRCVTVFLRVRRLAVVPVNHRQQVPGRTRNRDFPNRLPRAPLPSTLILIRVKMLDHVQDLTTIEFTTEIPSNARFLRVTLRWRWTKTNRTSPVGTDDGPGLDLGPNLGTGSARGIKEGIGEELVVGKTIERGNGIQGTPTGHIEVELTGRVVRAGMEEGARALTAPWRNGWVFDLPLFIHPALSEKTIEN